MRFRAGLVAASAWLAGCGDRSEPFALPDGCYYVEDGIPILKVHGEQGLILTPAPQPNPSGYTYVPVRRVHLQSRVDRDGAYVEVTPGFYLTDSFGAARAQPAARFTIDRHPARPAILIGMEAWGETPARLGRPC